MVQRRILPLLVALLAGACAQQEPLIETVDVSTEPILGTFTLDPVLLWRGSEVAGDQRLTAEYANFRYLFANAETRSYFLAQPDRYAIRLGGACGRMGALSGTGRTDLWARHDGGLYIFASEGCRATFLAGPEKLLDPGVDPIHSAGFNEALLADQLLTRSLAWLGGADAVDNQSYRWDLNEQVTSGETEYQHVYAEVVGPGLRLHSADRWNGEGIEFELDSAQGAIHDDRIGRRTMRPSQVRAMQRRALAHLLVLYQGRDADGVIMTAEGADADGVATLHLAIDGLAHAVGVHQETGEIRWHRFRGHAGHAEFGVIQHDFQDWARLGALRVPSAWSVTLDGEAEAEVDRRGETWALTAL